MYLNVSALNLAASLRHERKLATRIQSRLLSAMVALGCFVLLAVSNSGAQQNNTINTVRRRPDQSSCDLAAIPNHGRGRSSGAIYVASSYNCQVYSEPGYNSLTVFAGAKFRLQRRWRAATIATMSAPAAVGLTQFGKGLHPDNNARVSSHQMAISTVAGSDSLHSNMDPCGDGDSPAAGVKFYQPGLYVTAGNYSSPIPATTGSVINTEPPQLQWQGYRFQLEISRRLPGMADRHRLTQPCGDGRRSLRHPPSNPSGARSPGSGMSRIAPAIHIGDARDRASAVWSMLWRLPATYFPECSRWHHRYLRGEHGRLLPSADQLL